MNCKECRDLLSEYCDSDLDGTKARAVKAHLKKCADCREQNNLTEAMEAAARALPHHAPGVTCKLIFQPVKKPWPCSRNTPQANRS